MYAGHYNSEGAHGSRQWPFGQPNSGLYRHCPAECCCCGDLCPCFDWQGAGESCQSSTNTAPPAFTQTDAWQELFPSHSFAQTSCKTGALITKSTKIKAQIGRVSMKEKNPTQISRSIFFSPTRSGISRTLKGFIGSFSPSNVTRRFHPLTVTVLGLGWKPKEGFPLLSAGSQGVMLKANYQTWTAWRKSCPCPSAGEETCQHTASSCLHSPGRQQAARLWANKICRWKTHKSLQVQRNRAM